MEQMQMQREMVQQLERYLNDWSIQEVRKILEKMKISKLLTTNTNLSNSSTYSFIENGFLEAFCGTLNIAWKDVIVTESILSALIEFGSRIAIQDNSNINSSSTKINKNDEQLLIQFDDAPSSSSLETTTPQQQQKQQISQNICVFLRPSGVILILKAAEVHSNVPRIQFLCLQMIRNISSDDIGSRMLLDINALDTLVSILLRVTNDRIALVSGLSSLSNILVSQVQARSLLGNDHLKVFNINNNNSQASKNDKKEENSTAAATATSTSNESSSKLRKQDFAAFIIELISSSSLLSNDPEIVCYALCILCMISTQKSGYALLQPYLRELLEIIFNVLLLSMSGPRSSSDGNKSSTSKANLSSMRNLSTSPSQDLQKGNAILSAFQSVKKIGLWGKSLSEAPNEDGSNTSINELEFLSINRSTESPFNGSSAFSRRAGVWSSMLLINLCKFSQSSQLCDESLGRFRSVLQAIGEASNAEIRSFYFIILEKLEFITAKVSSQYGMSDSELLKTKSKEVAQMIISDAMRKVVADQQQGDFLHLFAHDTSKMYSKRLIDFVTYGKMGAKVNIRDDDLYIKSLVFNISYLTNILNINIDDLIDSALHVLEQEMQDNGDQVENIILPISNSGSKIMAFFQILFEHPITREHLRNTVLIKDDVIASMMNTIRNLFKEKEPSEFFSLRLRSIETSIGLSQQTERLLPTPTIAFRIFPSVPFVFASAPNQSHGATASNPLNTVSPLKEKKDQQQLTPIVNKNDDLISFNDETNLLSILSSFTDNDAITEYLKQVTLRQEQLYVTIDVCSITTFCYQLTRLLYDNHSSLDIKTILDYFDANSNPQVSSIVRYIKEYLCCVRYFQLQILQNQSCDIRAKNIECIIEIAEKSISERFHNSLLACAALDCLTSPSIHRLMRTWGKVNSEKRQKFDLLRKNLSFSKLITPIRKLFVENTIVSSLLLGDQTDLSIEQIQQSRLLLTHHVLIYSPLAQLKTSSVPFLPALICSLIDHYRLAIASLESDQDVSSINNMDKLSNPELLIRSYQIISMWIPNAGRGEWYFRIHDFIPDPQTQTSLRKAFTIVNKSNLDELLEKSKNIESEVSLLLYKEEMTRKAEVFVERLFHQSQTHESHIIHEYRDKVIGQISDSSQIIENVKKYMSLMMAKVNSLEWKEDIKKKFGIYHQVESLSSQSDEQEMSKSLELDESLFERVQLKIEQEIIYPVSSQLIDCIYNLHHETEDKLQTKINLLKHLPRENLCDILHLKDGLFETYNMNCRSAVVKMKMFDQSILPSYQLDVLLSVKDEIYLEAERNGAKEVNADDLLPILAYVIVQSDLKHPWTTVSLLRELVSAYDLPGEKEYYLVSIEITLKHLVSLSLQ